MKTRRWTKFLIIILLVFFGLTWQNFTNFTGVKQVATMTRANTSPLSGRSPQNIVRASIPDWARVIDISSVNPRIVLDMRYATANNFMKRKLYGVARCALRAGVASKLSRVQEDLEKRGLGLKVFDCYRPLSVTKQMWAILPDSRYVANPARGSRHNRGAAVDLALIDQYGRDLEMPTAFDDFSERAWRSYKGQEVTTEARRNSQLLEEVMKKYGFVPLATEWWHFDSADWQKFSLLDVPLEAIP